MKPPTNTFFTTYLALSVRLYGWFQGVKQFGRDEGGVAMTEYVVLLGTVSVGVAAAIAALGPGIVGSYERARAILISPLP